MSSCGKWNDEMGLRERMGLVSMVATGRQRDGTSSARILLRAL